MIEDIMILEKPLFWHWCKQETGNIAYLARELGVSRSFISYLVNNKKPIPVEHIQKIKQITGLKAKDLRPDLYEIFKEDLV